MKITQNATLSRKSTPENKVTQKTVNGALSEPKDGHSGAIEYLKTIEQHDALFVRDQGWFHSPLENREKSITAEQVQRDIAKSGAAFDGSLYIVHQSGTARVTKMEDFESASKYLSGKANQTEPNLMHRALKELDSKGWSFRELDKKPDELGVQGPFGAFVEVPGPSSGRIDAVSPGGTHMVGLDYDNLLALDFVHGRKDPESLTNPDKAPLLQEVMSKGFNLGSGTNWQGVESLNRSGKTKVTYQGRRVGEITDKTDKTTLRNTLKWELEKTCMLEKGLEKGTLSEEKTSFARYAFDRDLPEGVEPRASLELGLSLLEARKSPKMSSWERSGFERVHQTTLQEVTPAELKQAGESQAALLKMGGLDFLQSLHSAYSRQAQNSDNPLAFKDFLEQTREKLSKPQEPKPFAQTAQDLLIGASERDLERIAGTVSGLMSTDDQLSKFAELTKATSRLSEDNGISGHLMTPGARGYNRGLETKGTLLNTVLQGVKESTSFTQLAEVTSELLEDVDNSRLRTFETRTWTRAILLTAGEPMGSHFSSQSRVDELTHFREHNTGSYSAREETSFLKTVGIKSLKDAATQADKVGTKSAELLSSPKTQTPVEASSKTKAQSTTVPLSHKPTHYSSAPKFRQKQYDIARSDRDQALDSLKEGKKTRLVRNGIPALALTAAFGGAGLVNLGVVGALAALSKVGVAVGGLGFMGSVIAFDDGRDVKELERKLEKQERALNTATYALDRTSN